MKQQPRLMDLDLGWWLPTEPMARFLFPDPATPPRGEEGGSLQAAAPPRCEEAELRPGRVFLASVFGALRYRLSRRPSLSITIWRSRRPTR